LFFVIFIIPPAERRDAVTRKFRTLAIFAVFLLALCLSTSFRGAEAESRPAKSAADAWEALIDQSLDQLEKQQFEPARLSAGKALKLAEETFGAGHVETANTLAVLGHIYDMQGKYSQSVHLWRRALTIMEKNFGPAHPVVADFSRYLALTDWNTGKLDEAAALYQRALSILEKAQGQSSPELDLPLYALGSLQIERKKYAEAEALLERLLAIRRRVNGPESREAADALDALSAVYRAQNRIGEAEAARLEAEKIVKALATRPASAPGSRAGAGESASKAAQRRKGQK